MKNVQRFATTRSLNHSPLRGIALGAVILAASAGSAMAQSATPTQPRPMKTASAAGETTIVHKTIETRSAPVESQPVVPRNTPAAKPVAAPVQRGQVAAAGVDLEHIKATLGWVDLPARIVAENNAALAERAKSTLGWIDVPSDIAGVQSDDEAAAAVRNAVPQ